MHLRRPSITSIVAMLALSISLGGSAIAASHYLITNAGQIKPSVLRKLKGSKGAAGASGAAGPQGPSGPQGPAGPAGPSNVSGLIEVKGARNPVPAEKVSSSVATCPVGTHVVAGGDAVFAGEMAGFDSEAERPQSWFVIVSNASTFGGGFIEAIAYCSGAGQAVAASVPKVGHPGAAKAVAAMEAQLTQSSKAKR
jgi:hypothetical protein